MGADLVVVGGEAVELGPELVSGGGESWRARYPLRVWWKRSTLPPVWEWRTYGRPPHHRPACRELPHPRTAHSSNVNFDTTFNT